MRLTGNVGEWSEFYAFIKLLSQGKLYAADANLNKMNDTFFPILKILRDETLNIEKEYIIDAEGEKVRFSLTSDTVKEIPQSVLIEMAETLYQKIVAHESTDGSFEIEESADMLRELGCSKIKASSRTTADIRMQLHDINTGYNPICGFSVKSKLGSPATLFNASKATNFIYTVEGLSAEQADQVNSINDSSKILKRVRKIYEHGSLKYKTVANQVFDGNLMLIDTYMGDIIGAMLLDHYTTGISDCKELVRRLEESNPLGYSRNGIYEYKMKKFFCSVALGMKPATAWDGCDEASGGYIIVRSDGDVVAYHIYNRNEFENYLLNNTKLERPSTGRHKYATIYTEDNVKYFNLNLQIRFK